MTFRFVALFCAALGLWTLPAAAHPHVFVTVKSTVVYAGGVPKAVRHSWRFDDMFSSFAVQGLDADGDGKLSRGELQALAEINVTSLKEFEFFTAGTAGGHDMAFAQPTDYWLDHDGKALTLNFTLPITAVKPSDTVRVEIYDPSYFVSFSLAENAPGALDGAPDGCRIDGEGPQGTANKLSEEFFSNLQPDDSWGKQFANVLTVRCGADAVAYAQALASTSKPADEGRPAAAPAEAAAPAASAARVEQAMAIAEEAPLQQIPTEETAKDVQPSLGAFGVVRSDGALAQKPGAGPLGWIARQQAEFYRLLSAEVARTKSDGSALWLLVGLSFAYGVFHAAGPGHGKTVISSYLLATGETLRRGIAVSFAASLAQAAMAIAVVGVFAVLLGATSQAMGVAAWWLEAASYLLIAGLGVALIARALRKPLPGAQAEACPDPKAASGGGKYRLRSVCTECGHSHAPAAEALAGRFSWRRAGAAVLAVGLRPCTGALLVLVFALGQGLIWAGMAATFAMAVGTAITVSAIAALAVGFKELALRLASAGSGRGGVLLALKSIRVLGAVAVLALGLFLLGGLLATGVPAA